MRLALAFAALCALAAAPPEHGGDTDCDACHTAEGWRVVKFDHSRTGFVLEGRHRDLTCRACHSTSAFADPVPRACSACHRDVHLGRLGQRCQDCHEPTSWATHTFGPDAHRRTSFPLTGRHALLPCESCHGDRRDRGFNRPSPRCLGCHQADWERASSGAAEVNHDQAGFSQDCRACHSTWRFSPASFPAHEECFDGAMAGMQRSAAAVRAAGVPGPVELVRLRRRGGPGPAEARTAPRAGPSSAGWISPPRRT